jgi:glycosyltransferase involved in cell wall biosynthesis
VLAHLACGNSEVILHEENGYCDELGEVEDLVASMHKRFAEPEVLRRVGAAAQRHVAQNFSLDSMARGYHELYTRCAKRRSQVPA